MTGWRWHTLGARFDAVALRPFAWPAPAAPDWPALRAWCQAEPGRRLAVAHAPTAADAGPRAAALALQLDGSHALHACTGPMQRWALRLRVKLQDLRPGGVLQAGDIWDSGWVPDEPGAWSALVRLQPRRATFIVMDHLPVHRVQSALATMQQASATYARPVRVLLLGMAPDTAAQWVQIDG